MRLSRRRFLTLSLSAGLLMGGCGRQLLTRSSNATDLKRLAAYLDTLIPPDGTPGAVQLGVAEKIMARAARDREFQWLIQEGLNWLDQEAQRQGADHFVALSNTQRERVVALATGEMMGPLPQIFFEETRAEAFFHYYAHPESWRGLGYAGPPQPLGFMDYASAPSRQDLPSAPSSPSSAPPLPRTPVTLDSDVNIPAEGERTRRGSDRF